MKSKVYLIGAGPGRPDLITVRGLNALREADVVIYDHLVDRKILEYTKKNTELICCNGFSKRNPEGKFSLRQDLINRLLVDKAMQGKKTVRLKNGDPSVFGRFSQELEYLAQNRIEFEVIPGVTAATAAACLSGISITDRRFASSCVFVTGREASDKKKTNIHWNSIAENGTIILYMAIEELERIIEKLIVAGKSKDTAVAAVTNISRFDQKTIIGDLGNIVAEIKRHNLKPPAIVIIGEVAKLGTVHNWYRKTRRILFTGLSKERFFTNESYFHLPMIKILPMFNYKKFDSYLENITKFDWIVFASRYGVEYFFKRLREVGFDSRTLGNIKITAIGNSTKNRLSDFGIRADLVPRNESSKGLVARFKKINLRGKKIFLPRSDISDKGLSSEFEKLGAEVTTSFAYRNVMPDNLPDLDLKLFDEIFFTSPSTVRNFKKRYGRVPRNIKVRCIGDVTKKEAKRCKLLG